MLTSNNALNEKDFNNPYELFISVEVRFWLYIIPNILSVLCTFFALFHLLFDRTLRQALNNHIIIYLLLIGLIYELADVPLTLYYYRFSDTWTFSLSFAHYWTFIDYTCYTAHLIAFAWASVERHILIFHTPWVATKKKRFFVHYLPIIILTVYCFTYYFGFIVFPFCAQYILPSPFNGVPVSCVIYNPIFYRYDTISNQFIPVSLIIIATIGLFIRVLWQKSRLNRSIEWRKQKKMTIQLLSISMLYFIFMGPRTVLQLVVFVGYETNVVLVYLFHSEFFANYIIFFFPFVCCGSMPEIGKKLKKLLFWRRQRDAVVPITTNMTRTTNKRTVHIETNLA